jgi:transposase
MRRHEITDEQWERIEPLLPGRDGDPGRSGEDNRKFVNACFWIAKTGAPWRDLPERFGKWNSVFQRFNRWCKNRVWERVLKTVGGDPDLENLLLDSTIVRAHQHAAGGKGGKKLSHWDGPAVDSARKFMSPSAAMARQ